jgi:SpoVK/Ycf46/Vps4 family AAA+-type ATPase
MEGEESKAQVTPYKFRELKVYSSTEWLADNKKKYRQVFDRQETTFVYAELSFYNKLFDEDAWDVTITLKCFSLARNKKEICNLELKKKISKYDHTVYVREGWGNKKEGSFWARGTYYWEAWMDDIKVATKYFYIEEMDDVQDEEVTNYLDLKSIRLYEGKYDDVSPEDRKFFKAFAVEDTRYIYAEIKCENHNIFSNWQCELFVKFFNQSRELKGQVIRLSQVKENDDSIEVTAGWGANIKGSWRKGIYSVEVVFMDRLLGIMPFEIGDEFVEGVGQVQLPNLLKPMFLQAEEDSHLSLEDIMSKLDSLIGLNPIKKQVREHAQYLKFIQLRKDKGYREDNELSIHAVFTGNPGTGKTTVAKMMGKLYRKMGLISRGHVHEVDRVSLVGEYIGQTAPKVKDAIEKARGGILFIDEAYALARTNDDTKDFGREVIEILVKEMSDGPGDIAVIVAGYPKEMKHFLESNPGLRSRFKLFYDFADYQPNELWEIVDYAATEMELEFEPEAQALLNKIIIRAYRNRDRSFGNARYIFDLVEKAKINLGLRIMADENPKGRAASELKLIELQDVVLLDDAIIKELPDIPIDDELLELSLKEMDDLVGMKSVKQEIKELISLVRYYQSIGVNPLNKLFLHTLFIGNPGTGKTTVARILAKVFRALGILERGHIIETDRQGLVAGFVGQTAIKTSKKIDEAQGGVLFVDEAYALTGAASAHADYGHEAIQTILKRMEDDRGTFFLFAAGYPDNMEKFLKSNPGLRSRFDKILKFDDYSPVDLYDIAKQMLSKEHLKLSKAAGEYLHQVIFHLHRGRDKFFGNARSIRHLVNAIAKNQHLRMSAAGETSKREMYNVLVEDIRKVEMQDENKLFAKKKIGFKSRE